MTLGISTSSPMVSVALFDAQQDCVGHVSRLSPRSASSSIAELTQSLLESANLGIRDMTHIAVDIGPGGFTSVRVGVTFAKCLAWSLAVPLTARTSFELMNHEGTLGVPVRKGTWLVSRSGNVVETCTVVPEECRGYGLGTGEDLWPSATLFGRLADGHGPVDPMALVPYYVLEPNISQPKDKRVLSHKPS